MYEGNILPRILEGLLSFAKARKHGWKSAFHPWKSWMERFLATRVDGCFTRAISWPEISASRRLGTVRETAYILPLTLAAKAKGPINFPSDWSSFYPVPFCSNCCYLFVNYSANFIFTDSIERNDIMIKKKKVKGMVNWINLEGRRISSIWKSWCAYFGRILCVVPLEICLGRIFKRD